MLNQIGKRMQGKEGFTLIELMVVIAIIGILAAIAIPNFLAMRQKGMVSQAQSDCANVKTAQETYYNDNSTYAATTTNLSLAGIWKFGPKIIVGGAGNASTYGFTCRHSSTTVTYSISPNGITTL